MEKIQQSEDRCEARGFFLTAEKPTEVNEKSSNEDGIKNGKKSK